MLNQMEMRKFTLEWQKIHCGVLTEFGPTAKGISSKITSPAFISLVATKYLETNHLSYKIKRTTLKIIVQ